MKSGLYLVHLSEGVVITQFALSKGVNRVGRIPESQIVLPDWSVSRRHADVRVTQAEVTVADLNSRNGTFIGNRRVRSSTISPGQEIRFGAFRLVLLEEERLPVRDSSAEDAHDPRYPGKPTLRTPTLPTEPLTPAERPVLQLLLEGRCEREIAEILGLSPHTVHNHVRAIYKAYSVHKKADLLRHLLPRVDQTVIFRCEDIGEI